MRPSAGNEGQPGLQIGDIIMAIDGERLNGRHLSSVLPSKGPGPYVHAACARMNIAFGCAAVSEASWRQRPLASAMSLQPVPVCRGSALAGAWPWAMSKRALKKMKMRADARAARAELLCAIRARRRCLLSCLGSAVDPLHRSGADFRVQPAPQHPWAGVC